VATETELKEEALRVLRNVLEDIAEVWRAYPDETYDYWEASLKHADFLFGLYEKSFENPEDTDTLDLSSAVNELVEALGELRQLEKDEREDEDPEEWCDSVRTETIGPVEEALAEVQYALDALRESEAPLSDDVQNLIAELLTSPEPPDAAVDEAKRAFVETLAGVLKQVKEPYTEQGDLAEKFWEAGFRYADELLGKWEELEYPEGSQDPTNLGGALKDLWEAAANLHGVDEEGEPVAESFPTYLNEAEDALTDIDPNWRN
jgi:hypothetical protein